MATFGTFFELGGRGALEALSRSGFDYVIIDTEHGPFPWRARLILSSPASAAG